MGAPRLPLNSDYSLETPFCSKITIPEVKIHKNKPYIFGVHTENRRFSIKGR